MEEAVYHKRLITDSQLPVMLIFSGGINYLVNVTYCVDHKGSLERNERDERGDGVYRDHDHNSDDHPVSAITSVITRTQTTDTRELAKPLKSWFSIVLQE